MTHVFRFAYRGDATEEWSVKWHFKGPPPGDDPSWLQLSTDVWNCEVHVLPATTSLVRAYGYNDNDPNANHVWVQDYTVPGPPPNGTMSVQGVKMSGDQAACVQWMTQRLSSKGKPVYLRKYLHDGQLQSGGGDPLMASYVIALETFAAAGANGIQSVHGGLRSAAYDDIVKTVVIHPYSTTRTLKRRGKRPKAG